MKITLVKPLFCGILATVLVSCKQESKPETARAENVPGINLQLMDTTVSPKNDFFRYVNGKWVDNTEIPAEKSSWGGFNELRKKTSADVLAILKNALNDPELDPASDQAKAVNLFRTIMDTLTRDQNGIKPLKTYLEKIDQISNINDLQAYLIEMEPLGAGGFIGFRVGPDAKDSNKNIASINPGSLGLPDRDYYVGEDADSRDKREKYVAHIARMLQFLGDDEAMANDQAAEILVFETKMAAPRLDKVQRRDRRLSYNPTAVADLNKLTPAIDWEGYLKGIGAQDVDTVNVSQIEYMKSLQSLLSENNVKEWKSYLRWTLLNKAAGMLTADLEKADWEFYEKTLKGSQKQTPREEAALQTIDRAIGEALGKLYVAEKFPQEAKEQALEMIHNLLKAYEIRINALPWMDAATKQKAIEKLSKLTIKVGYPDKWKDYSALKIQSVADGGTYYSNMVDIANWSFKRNLEKLSQPVDKTEWGMSPQTVNAYYRAPYNEIVFPAAIMQPPFFNFTADAAVNYGGMGAVIGHEISHGFDDSGADYDGDGNLVNWWTEKDLKQFNSLGDSLAAQYSRIEVLPEIYINGKFTLGENIGDLGGVNAAYDALQLYLQEHGDPGLIDGFTPEQRFFMSWATVWRTKSREEALANQVKTDPHSPGKNRATQPLVNIDAFYNAFDIKEGDGMFLAPEKRVKIW